MAASRTSSAPLYVSPSPVYIPGILVEDTGTDLILHKHGANQNLSDDRAQHVDQSTNGPRGNKVQDGALALLGTHSALGRPDKVNPLGRQDG